MSTFQHETVAHKLLLHEKSEAEIYDASFPAYKTWVPDNLAVQKKKVELHRASSYRCNKPSHMIFKTHKIYISPTYRGEKKTKLNGVRKMQVEYPSKCEAPGHGRPIFETQF